MNPPPQIGSRVRWWDARGQTQNGTVKAINVLSDNSHVVVIQVENAQNSTVTLPPLGYLDVYYFHLYHNITKLNGLDCDIDVCAEKHDVRAYRMGRDESRLEEWRRPRASRKAIRFPMDMGGATSSGGHTTRATDQPFDIHRIPVDRFEKEEITADSKNCRDTAQWSPAEFLAKFPTHNWAVGVAKNTRRSP
ncbi:hypothetical protein V8E53_009193 [Lactarius tabidus]